MTARDQGLAARLSLFDATLVVMGGIVGSGIFINPAVVAQRVHGPRLILLAWTFGGVVALLGAFIYAELAARLPRAGGQYAYLREALHPIFGFLYGWVLLLVINAGGTAAVAITFARYFRELTGTTLHEGVIATGSLVLLTAVNCLGVKSGSAAQGALMLLKIAAIAALIACGAVAIAHPHPVLAAAPLAGPTTLTAFGAALVPVLFAYGGWQTASFLAAEVKEPRKNLPRALLIGVIGVIALYLGANLVYVRALGAEGLAQSPTPASAVMELALGQTGRTLIALGIAVSTLGFLGQSILTTPRVYFAMAKDGLFFKSVASVHPRTRAPIVAIVLQGAVSVAVALSGKYEQILGYVVSMDFLFFALTAGCIFVLRRRDANTNGYGVPGHPYSTGAFIAISLLVVLNTFYKYPWNSFAGLAILASGVPAYLLWRRASKPGR